jgi:zinc finger protein
LSPKGISIIFKPKELSDINREVIKSQFATIKFEELGLEIPPTGRAEINTVEGILSRV